MRFIMVLAGAFGFSAALIGGFLAGKPIEMCLLHGIVSALVAAFLLRWWFRIWIRSLEQVSREDELTATLQEMERASGEQQSAASHGQPRPPH